ncbi:MAG: glycoside hydrolase family 5 protein, partial [Fibromonadales bacterium]|nr:glycoside hydrolase family 5 protein [Fibromonadales bacterium]
VFLCFFSLFSCDATTTTTNSNGYEPCLEINGPVACYGRLQASGNKLVGSKTGDNPVILRGVSLGWSNSTWESARFFNEASVNAMVDHWKAEIIRVPMGVNSSGVPNNKEGVRRAIDAALERGVYVIIDWHSHTAHREVAAATAFFEEMAGDYGHLDNVIFEIYNEPIDANGGTWTNIKAYAEQIIPVIRAHSQNLILVGTPRWCQQVDAPLDNPLEDGNIAYVIHFYADSHGLGSPEATLSYAARMTRVLEAGYPVFTSEYGTTHSDGGSRPNRYESHNGQSTDEWHAFMDEHKISSAAWNVNYKAEGSAFFGVFPQRVINADTWDGWTNENEMTSSGKYIYNKLRAYAEHADWRGH